jgi:hypothetical protein
MAFNIKEFSAGINKTGLAVSNLFVVRIGLPPVLTNDQSDIPQTLTLLCKNAQIPSTQIQTSPIQLTGMGNPERRPVNMTFNELPVTFMVDGQYKTLRFFQRWQQLIINYDQNRLDSTVTGRRPFEMAYKSEYVTTVEVIMYSYNSSEIMYVHKFKNAFPTSIGDITLAWGNNAEIMELPINFTFDHMETSGMIQGSANERNDSGSGILGTLSSLQTLGSAISSLRVPRNLQDVVSQFNTFNTINTSLLNDI